MAAQIGGIGSGPLAPPPAGSGGEGPARTKRPEQAERGDSRDQVSISRAAQDLQSSLERVPDVRTERVAQLRAEVEQGTYEVDSQAVADRLLRDSVIDNALTAEAQQGKARGG